MAGRPHTPEEKDPGVTIIRSGYASRDLWLAAIAQAERQGRRVVAIDAVEPDPDEW